MIRVRETSESLISIGDPVPLRNLIEIVLDGLPEAYDPIVAAVISKEDLCSLDELESSVLAHESRFEKNRKSVIIELVSVNLTHAPSFSSPLMFETFVDSTESSPDFPTGTSHVTVNAGNHGYSSRGGRFGRGGGRFSCGGGRLGTIQCQLCHKPGHDASICYHIYSHSSQPQRASSNPFMMTARPPYPPSFGYSVAPRQHTSTSSGLSHWFRSKLQQSVVVSWLRCVSPCYA